MSMYGMSTVDARKASQARQRRAEADAAVEKAARKAQHRATYLASLAAEGEDSLKRAVARDRAATAHRAYLAARVEQAEAYGGAMAGTGAALALAEHDGGERMQARMHLAELVGASNYAELREALARRGYEL